MACAPDKSLQNIINKARQKIDSLSKQITNLNFGTIIKGAGAKLIPNSLKPQPPAKVELQQNHRQVIENTARDLIDIETEMTPGGTQILSYTNDLHINIGSQYVSSEKAPPVRKFYGDAGYPIVEKIEIGKKRTDVKQKNIPYFQTISHPVPWGNYSILANNSYNITVGAGGLTMSTEGNMDFTSGAVTNFSSLYDFNLTSAEGSINIICGNHINIVGDTVNIQTCNENDQVVISSNLGIKKNAVVHGSLYVDGEIYAHHMTVPCQTQETSQNAGTAYTPEEATIAYADLGPLALWFDSVFLTNLNAALAAAFAGPMTGTFIPVVASLNATGMMAYPGMKMACRSFGLKPGIPNGMNCFRPGAPVGSFLDIARDLGEIHYADNASKAIHTLPHSHNFYGPATTKLAGNPEVRTEAGSIINSGETGVANSIVHGGAGLS
jgi:hypothetical protein